MAKCGLARCASPLARSLSRSFGRKRRKAMSLEAFYFNFVLQRATLAYPISVFVTFSLSGRTEPIRSFALSSRPLQTKCQTGRDCIIPAAVMRPFIGGDTVGFLSFAEGILKTENTALCVMRPAWRMSAILASPFPATACSHKQCVVCTLLSPSRPLSVCHTTRWHEKRSFR